MSKFEHVQLAKLIERVINWNPAKEAPEVFFRYIDISSIDRDSKEIVETSSVMGKEAPSRARQLVQAHDVLVSTVRPNLNAVAQVPETLDGGTASTGYCVLRPKNGQLDARYLFHWVKTPTFVENMVLQATGANYPAVTDTVIKSSTIPLPPLGEQQRIAAILDKADMLRAKRRTAVARLDALLQSTFLHLFGDPVTNPMGWEVKQLNDVGTLERGKSKNRPRNAPELIGGPYPLIQTGDIANADGGYLTAYSQTYSELGLKQSRMWKAGVLCITIAANIANTGVLTFDACFPDSVVGFLPNSLVRTEYVQYWLGFLRGIIEEKAPQVAQKNINLKILRELEIPVPPIDLQDNFVQVVKKHIELRSYNKQHVNQLDNLFHALQQRAFNGQL
ncbi:MAG: restriction endonuclease subunit S [Ardenticatenaceae bacterium]|nr:restriction endonuclease subunit S [Ardenticatenaceae bacterium]